MPEATSSPAPLDDPAAIDDAEAVATLRDAVRVFFSRPSPRWLVKVSAAAWGGRALFGPPRPSDVVACVAVVAYWPLQEWLAHKHLLHVEPTKRFDPLFAQKHRQHHASPRDIGLILLPMEVLRPSTAVHGALWVGLAGPRVGLTGLGAMTAMALVYEWTHFLVHTGYRPKGRFFKRVRRNHRMHHFLNENYWYSFTLPAIDTLFGTNPEPRDIPKSATARDLHGLERAASARA